MAEKKRAEKDDPDYRYDVGDLDYTELDGEDTGPGLLDNENYYVAAFMESYVLRDDESPSSSSAIKEASKKTESSSSSSRNGESSGTVEINREHGSQNQLTRATSSFRNPRSGQTMNQLTRATSSCSEPVPQNPRSDQTMNQLTRATSSTLSPKARPWSPQNTAQQRPPMANQMDITRPAFVNNQLVSAMHQFNLNASTPRNQMAVVPPSPSQASMMQQHNHYFVTPPVMPMMNNQQPNFMGPGTNQLEPYYLPMVDPMMSPSGPFGFDQNYFNQQLQPPIDATHWYNERSQHMQRFPPPRTQQSPRSQWYNARPSSNQGQDKNQKPPK